MINGLMMILMLGLVQIHPLLRKEVMLNHLRQGSLEHFPTGSLDCDPVSE
jgi:hypothetical protein